MPGSRQREFDAVMPVVLGAARQLQARDARLQFALPLASERYRVVVEAAVRARGLRDVAVYRPDSYAVLGQARVVVQCSGTATLETALLGLPSVIVYRCRAIEYLVARHLYQSSCPSSACPTSCSATWCSPSSSTATPMPPHLSPTRRGRCSPTSTRRAGIRRRLAALRELLGPPGASERAAQAIIECCSAGRRSGRTAVPR